MAKRQIDYEKLKKTFKIVNLSLNDVFVIILKRALIYVSNFKVDMLCLMTMVSSTVFITSMSSHTKFQYNSKFLVVLTLVALLQVCNFSYGSPYQNNDIFECPVP